MSAKPKRASPQFLSDDDTARLNTDLLQAAYDGSLDGVRVALEQGASIAVFHEPTGLTALHIAAGTNNLALCRYLVEEWNAPFGPDKFGRWPTLIAAECHASDELGDYIVEREAEFLAQNPA